MRGMARDCMLAAMKIIVRWLLLACALLLVASLYSGVQVSSYGQALVAQGHGVDLWAEGLNLDSAVDRFHSLATPHEC